MHLKLKRLLAVMVICYAISVVFIWNMHYNRSGGRIWTHPLHTEGRQLVYQVTGRMTPRANITWDERIVRQPTKTAGPPNAEISFGANATSIRSTRDVHMLSEVTITTLNRRHVYSKCGNIHFPLHLGVGDTWYVVHPDVTAAIFSAYHVVHEKMLVIIGTSLADSRTRLFCQLWYTGNGSTSVTMEETASLREKLPESHDLKYTATLFKCDIPLPRRPNYVSMVTTSCDNPSNLLPVRRIATRGQAQHVRRFTVCLSPLNLNYSRAYELVEWLELNQILGAQTFIVYNYSSAGNVAAALKHYTDLGLVEVVQWNIPHKVNTWPQHTTLDIHYFGQVAFIHDCLYRNKGESEIVAYLDLDEFIIPHSNGIDTWLDILREAGQGAGAYIFRNTFFRKEWHDTEAGFVNKNLALKYKMVTLLKTKREKTIMRYRMRSKCFVNTTLVDRVQIHDAVTSKAVKVPAELALLHHYRDWEKYNEPEDIKQQDDIVVTKYAKQLTENVHKFWSNHQDIAPDLHTT